MNASKVALFEDDTQAWRLIEGSALMLLAKLPDACVDAVVTDPPYGIEFRGEAWDGDAIRQAAQREGEVLSTSEALERWTAVWSSEARRVLKPGGHLLAFGAPRTFHRLVAGVEDAGLEVRDQLLWLFGTGVPKSRRLSGGYGTALKPAYEPVLLARAPLAGSTADNLARYGTGALGIEAARIGAAGYWPAHVALSHAPGCEKACTADCPVRMIDSPQSDALPSRLFYCAKASKPEREAGCDELPLRSQLLYNRPHPRLRRNIHPTVKPLSLMRWLVALVTPPGGVVLDPFAGSGSTGIAAVGEGRRFLGIEREGDYVDIACARLTHWAHLAAKETA
jgi:site-specific DNA-methyltransferase (adenine-specific)